MDESQYHPCVDSFNPHVLYCIHLYSSITLCHPGMYILDKHIRTYIRTYVPSLYKNQYVLNHVGQGAWPNHFYHMATSISHSTAQSPFLHMYLLNAKQAVILEPPIATIRWTHKHERMRNFPIIKHVYPYILQWCIWLPHVTSCSCAYAMRLRIYTQFDLTAKPKHSYCRSHTYKLIMCKKYVCKGNVCMFTIMPTFWSVIYVHTYIRTYVTIQFHQHCPLLYV